MDINTIIDLLAKSNIDNEKLTALITLASTLDLTDEENQRLLIRKSCEVANKDLNLQAEDNIINIIKEKGISNDLFKYVK